MLPPGCLVADLIEQLKEVWRADGLQIIQALDANSDIYNGHRHPAFSASPINMNCVMDEAMDCQVLNSHVNGRDQITTIFGTPGLVSGDGMV